MSTVFDTYLDEVLPSFFSKYNLPVNVISVVTNDIGNRIYSLLSHWNDIEFRRVILSTGLEEATFYEPKVGIELRCFVVAAIRNSLFENLVSTKKAARDLGLDTRPIPECDVKNFTQEAIFFFKDIDFDELNINLQLSSREDVYKDLPGKYPVAWKALFQLGKWSNKAQNYNSLNIGPYDLPELQKRMTTPSKSIPVDVQSGIDSEFNRELLGILSQISQSSQPFFYTDCFKMLTRNIDKLLKVIEYVLRRDCIFITSNLYLSNGYVSKRKELLPPAHTTREINENLKNVVGLHKTHLQTFKVVSNALLQ
ncbi:hypothetical protein ACFDTO_22855 [Microbacteriaceae bacterium 4G12]